MTPLQEIFNYIKIELYDNLVSALDTFPMMSQTMANGLSLSVIIATLISIFILGFILIAPITLVYRALRRLGGF